jgi:hypothetical protein
MATRELHGWKEIAVRLQCSVSQAKRLAAQGTLPVLKMGRGEAARVFAFEDAVDAWIKKWRDDNIRPRPMPAAPPVPVAPADRHLAVVNKMLARLSDDGWSMYRIRSAPASSPLTIEDLARDLASVLVDEGFFADG